ncbi:MAG: hypothetical protein ACKOA7_03315, partial [Bacteroidota bacterium]
MLDFGVVDSIFKGPIHQAWRDGPTSFDSLYSTQMGSYSREPLLDLLISAVDLVHMVDDAGAMG